MIKQKRYKKCTAVGKRRINLFKLEQAVKRQSLINQNQVRTNQMLTMQTEDLAERVRMLEQKELFARKGFLAWLLVKMLTMQIEDLEERVRLLEQKEPFARKGFLSWLLAKLK